MYQNSIREIIGNKHDPRHVEAWIRVTSPTLDNLSVKQFEDEVEVATLCVQTEGIKASEKLAKSYGL